jgi:hypothetical protein
MIEESISRDIILQLVHDSIDEVNAQLGRERHVGKVPDTSLDGLDSLAYETEFRAPAAPPQQTLKNRRSFGADSDHRT